MVFNTTFNNISVISWRSILLVDVPAENHQPVASRGRILYYHIMYRVVLAIRTRNYHTITITTALFFVFYKVLLLCQLTIIRTWMSGARII